MYLSYLGLIWILDSVDIFHQFWKFSAIFFSNNCFCPTFLFFSNSKWDLLTAFFHTSVLHSAYFLLNYFQFTNFSSAVNNQPLNPPIAFLISLLYFSVPEFLFGFFLIGYPISSQFFHQIINFVFCFLEYGMQLFQYLFLLTPISAVSINLFLLSLFLPIIVHVVLSSCMLSYVCVPSIVFENLFVEIFWKPRWYYISPESILACFCQAPGVPSIIGLLVWGL